ncbi:MAG: 2Fe-2S iron-sulfur cluster-binding protein [Thermoanaerobaculia bacterium]|nr:2Fe-2S iron-sulfur cluster-binding protein [Thermoanaerobaculia bacterium]
MPKVTIDGREIEVERGENLIEAGKKVGVQIPHYCYHPRLSVVGQCRMCLVKVEGMPKLQTACTTQVMKDGMEVKVDDPQVQEAQAGVMEFLLINHPLDCPICDQAGECGLQDYSFKHGQAFSRFEYDKKRVYPGRERIPVGPHVLLNMNRCIQCTRCVRFTEEVTGTGELGFFQRGARAEIGVFPGKQLDNPLSTCVVDICPVGALTSTEFRFAERVWYLDKEPSICTGCDVGCNITLEHREGKIRRYKPRANPEVNDYWMCDYGRGTFRRYEETPRLTTPLLREEPQAEPQRLAWSEGIRRLVQQLAALGPEDTSAFLSAGFCSTEEAYLLRRLADAVESPHRGTTLEPGEVRRIPNPQGGIEGREAAPNRRGCELAGLTPGEGGFSATDLTEGDAAGKCTLLVVADADPGSRLHRPETVERLRRAAFLVVLGWGESPLSAVADLVLPTTTHAESDGTYVNCEHRLQQFERAFPAPTGARPAVDTLLEVLAVVDARWRDLTTAEVFERMAAEVLAPAEVSFAGFPARGLSLGDGEAAAG